MNFAPAIGLLGGTFDPIHYGHLRMALDVQQNLNLSEIRFIPCKQPVHKHKTVISMADRLALLQLAIQDQPGFRLDEREIIRPTPSYMIETLQSLRAELPATPLCLILGMDAFLGLPSWQAWEKLTDYAHFIIVKRGLELEIKDKQLLNWVQNKVTDNPHHVHTELAGSILFQELNAELIISATNIRAQIAAGLNPRYLLPDHVLTYIKDNKLYS